jgi:hypothetical protein
MKERFFFLTLKQKITYINILTSTDDFKKL